MSEAAIENMVRFTWGIPTDSRLDVELQEDGAYRATEVRPDLSTGRQFKAAERRIRTEQKQKAQRSSDALKTEPLDLGLQFSVIR